ncbi:MAG: metal-dependent hydrolase [Alphaproteobacteria bacterium]
MDTVTQMLFGATVAQAGFRHRLGRKAIVAGAVLGLVPDLDVAVGWVAGPFAAWEHHRGLTHSLFFGPVVGPLIGWGLWRFHRHRTVDRSDVVSRDTLRAWTWLAILVLMTHPLIDLFTSYGTQLLWPFTDTRFAIDALPIIDPVYSAILLAVVIIGSLARTRPRFAQDMAATALILIGAYSLGGWAINDHVKRVAAADFGEAAAIDAYPMLFQPYYRRVLARTPEAAHVGYYSVLNPRPIDWRAYPVETDPAIEPVRATSEAALFEWFSMDRVLWRAAPDPAGGTRVEATDLRYGLPGDTDHGFWGITANVGADNAISGEVGMLRIHRDASGDAFRRFWSDMTGR